MIFAQSSSNKLASKGPELGLKYADSKGIKTPIEALYEGGSCPIEGFPDRGYMAKRKAVCRRSLPCACWHEGNPGFVVSKANMENQWLLSRRRAAGGHCFVTSSKHASGLCSN